MENFRMIILAIVGLFGIGLCVYMLVDIFREWRKTKREYREMTREEIVKHIDKVFVEVDLNCKDMIEENMKLRNEMRYIKEQIESLEENENDSMR